MALEASSLAAKSCTPCRGGIPPLTSEEVATHQRQTPEWNVEDEARRIERTFKFKNFAEAFAFVEKAADLAEAEGHHPDISFGWGYATVSLQTKKIKGLHENDFIMAAKLDRGGVRMSRLVDFTVNEAVSYILPDRRSQLRCQATYSTDENPSAAGPWGCAEPSCCVRGSSGGALVCWVASKSILKGEDLWNTSPLVTSVTLPISCRRRRRHR